MTGSDNRKTTVTMAAALAVACLVLLSISSGPGQIGVMIFFAIAITASIGAARYGLRRSLIVAICSAAVALIVGTLAAQEDFPTTLLSPPRGTIVVRGPTPGPEQKMMCSEKYYGFPREYLQVFRCAPDRAYVRADALKFLYDWMPGYVALLLGMILSAETQQIRRTRLAVEARK